MYLHELLRQLGIAEHTLLSLPPGSKVYEEAEATVEQLTRQVLDCETSQAGDPKTEDGRVTRH